jgi:ABC-type cobalamin/Fe3+-siderophores transport system ATPase subunit
MRINQIRFKAGEATHSSGLSVRPGSTTVFIGPNNGGKSRALAEILHALAPTSLMSSKVIADADVTEISDAEFVSKLSKIQVSKLPNDSADVGIVAVAGRGGRQSFAKEYVRAAFRPNADVSQRQYAAQHFLRYFIVNLSGSDRLSLAGPSPAEPVGAVASTTIAHLLGNNQLRRELSELVFKAFGQYLVIDPTQMTQLRYMLSSVEPTGDVERHLTDEAVAFFASAEPLQEASDGTKAFVGIAGEIIAGDPDIIVIDEPEAFLHPSLASLLGKYISSNIKDDKQLFVATHSPPFLLGCVLSGAPVDVVRLTHRAGQATARHLSATRLKLLMTDPLFRSVGAVSALFYETAVVTEGDSDRAFYDEINNRLQNESSRGLGHSIFLNAHNKQTAVNIVLPLREIGIPAAMILDLDWVKEDGQVWDRYFSALCAPHGLKTGFAATRRYIRDRLSAANPNYKTSGGIDVLSVSDKAVANEFFDSMEQYGLFTVRLGELEHWLADCQIERAKHKWLASAFAAMGSDPSDPSYLAAGSGDVWEFLDRIAAWAANPSRKGMTV